MRPYNDRSMRRGVAIAAFALILAVPLWAQHGGGGHAGGFGGGGHSGGFGGGHFSNGSAGHSFSGGTSVHSFSGSGASRGFSQVPPTFGFNHPPTGGFTPPTSPLVRQPFSSNGFSRAVGRGEFANGTFGHDGFGGVHHRGGVGFQIRTYPYWWGYGWGWSYFDPWWSWWDKQDNTYDNSDYENDTATAAQTNEDNLREQQMLRQEQMDGDQDSYQNAYDQGYQDAQAENQAGYSQRYENVRPPLDPERMQEGDQTRERAPESTMRTTVLVFHDQHQQEVENYAIVDDTLWEFTPQQTVKIPLSEIDIPATIRANQGRGVTFNVPSSYEGS